MTISFNPLKANGHLFTHLPELDDLEFSLSDANAADDPGRPRDRRRLLHKPVAAFLLKSPPRRRPAQAHRPRLARHPRHGDAGTRLHGPDRLRQGRRQHRAKVRPSLRSCESRRGVGHDPYRVGLRPSGRWRTNLTFACACAGRSRATEISSSTKSNEGSNESRQSNNRRRAAPRRPPLNSVCSSSNPRAGTFRQFCHPPSARSSAQPDSDRPPPTRPDPPRSPSRSTISLSHSRQ